MTVTSYRGEPDQSDPGELDPATTGHARVPGQRTRQVPFRPGSQAGTEDGITRRRDADSPRSAAAEPTPGSL